MKNTNEEEEENRSADLLLKFFLLMTWLSLFIMTIWQPTSEHLHGRPHNAVKVLDDALRFDGKMFLFFGLVISTIYLVAWIMKVMKK